MDQRGGVIYSLILIQWRRRRSDRVWDNDVACAAQRWVTNDRRCVLLQNVRRGGKHTRTIVSICPSFRGKYVGPLRCRVSRCKPKAVSGIVLMTSLSLSFWFRDLSVLFTSQTLSLSGGGRLERKKRNLSFLLTERTIRHVNPLHFFPPIIHPCLRYYFRLLFFFSFFSQVGRNRCGTKRS